MGNLRKARYTLRSFILLLSALAVMFALVGWWLRKGDAQRDAVARIERASGWVFYNDSFVDGIIREPTAYERWIDGTFSREFRSEVTIVGIPDRSLVDPVIQKTIESLPKVSVLIVSCRKGEEVACETWVRRRFPRLSVEVRPDLIELDE